MALVMFGFILLWDESNLNVHVLNSSAQAVIVNVAYKHFNINFVASLIDGANERNSKNLRLPLLY